MWSWSRALPRSWALLLNTPFSTWKPCLDRRRQRPIFRRSSSNGDIGKMARNTINYAATIQNRQRENTGTMVAGSKTMVKRYCLRSENVRGDNRRRSLRSRCWRRLSSKVPAPQLNGNRRPTGPQSQVWVDWRHHQQSQVNQLLDGHQLAQLSIQSGSTDVATKQLHG